MKKKYIALILTALLAMTPVGVSAAEFTDGAEVNSETVVTEEFVFSAGIEDAPEEIPAAEAADEVSDGEAAEILTETWEVPEAAAAVTFTYRLNKRDGVAIITGYTGSTQNLVIPSSISDGGVNYTVTELERGAFKGHTELVTVSIPSTITYIGANYSGAGVFEGCTRLTEVSMAEGNKKAYLGYNTFKGCSSLKSIAIPGNYYEIGGMAFENCISLEKMSLGQNYTGDKQVITHSVFKNCTKLQEISLPTTLKAINNEAFKGCSSLKKAVIPEGVQKVEYGAFKECVSLTSASLPSTIETLGANYSASGVFEGCTRLATVSMKEGNLKAYLGYNTFRKCSSLKNIAIPGNYYEIGGMAFQDCISLEKMSLGQNYTGNKQVITHSVFRDCTKLQEISLPTTLEAINNEAFKGCSSLKKVVIPEGVRRVEFGAFKECVSLASAYIPSTIEKIGANYNASGVFEGCKLLADVVMKEGTQDAYLGFNTFKDCTSLRTIVIPGNYSELGNGVFRNCSSLLDVKLCESTYSFANQKLGAFLVENCGKLINFQIPPTVGKIDDKACDKCTSLTIIGKKGSAAESFAASKGIKFRTTPLPIGTITLAKPKLSAVKQGTSNYYVAFSWKSVANAKGYYVYRKAGTGSYKKIATVSTTSYTDKTKKTSGTAYYYTVRAYGGTGTATSGYNSGLKVTIRPLAPKAKSIGTYGSGLKIQWDSVSDITGYIVYRSENGGSWKKAATVKSTSKYYIDKNVKKGRTYSYRIYSYKKAGSTVTKSLKSSTLTKKR